MAIATKLLEAALLAAYKQSRNRRGQPTAVYRLTVTATDGSADMLYFAQPTTPAATLADAKAAMGGALRGSAKVEMIAVVTVVVEGIIIERNEKPLGAC